MNKGIKLEMVFDDIKRENGKIKAEIEFRTTPIDFNFVDKILGDNIRTAINAFPQKKEEWLPRRSIKGWTPTVQPFPDIETVRDFVYPKQIPQQATISIEISAFCKLKDYEQEFLYKHGKGAKNKQELIQKIAARMNNLSIDVSAGARGKEEHTVKTPLESIIAAIADPKLQTPQCVCEEVIPGNYSILKDEALTHLIDAIKGGTRSYPEKQGDPNGYRAISEKLKPPFKDSDSGELRLLIEHRANSPLVTALHNRLNKPGDPDDYFKEVKKAAEEMDKNRKRRAGYTPSLLPLCLNYQAHTQSIGWMDEAADGQTAGTAGKSLRLEALRIRL
ncbi:MAG: hypothetical protein LBD29_00765, partial [Treponema sp.]|nr:hypothetical protein [Treponema sp.]